MGVTIRLWAICFILNGISAQSKYYAWTVNLANYTFKEVELVGHSFHTVENAFIVTQCALACRKRQRCLSFNFYSNLKTCSLNDATHITNSNDIKPASNSTYHLKEAFAISQSADPCLSIPCNNEGTCLTRSDNTFSCFCPPTWTGTTCNVKVDIAWASWGEWSDCSNNCGDGMRSRERKCINRLDNSDKSIRLCSGMDKQLEYCKIKDCPYWGEWSVWSACTTSQKCGEGISTKSRTCINSDSTMTCFGVSVIKRICFFIECGAPLSLQPASSSQFGEGLLQVFDAKSSAWLGVCATSWSKANADVACRQMGFIHSSYASDDVAVDSMTQNFLNVNFTCANNENYLTLCPHSDWSVGSCSRRVQLRCVVDGRWSSWNSWSQCSVSCANGISIRKRNCSAPVPKNGGDNCLGSGNDSRTCSNQPCPVDGSWLNWNQWSVCNASCGGGQQSRNRFCIEPQNGGANCNGSPTSSQSCNTQPCSIDGTWQLWGDWSSCSVTCGGGKRLRKRKCNPPQFGGKDCPSDGDSFEEFCNDDPCKVDGQWSLWSRWMGCSVTCGTGQERRYRDCSAPENGGSTCQGDFEEYQQCRLNVCPTPAEWTQWTDWSGCSSTCGSSGVRSRNRICNQTSSGLNSLPCLEFNLSSQTKSCNNLSCTPNVRSCQEAFDRGLEEASFVQILLPGTLSTAKPTTVFCSFEGGRNITIVNSSYETDELVSFQNGAPQRSYRVIYLSNNQQINITIVKNLVFNSKECKQQISWKCKNFPINAQSGTRNVYWKNQYSDEMAYWGNATAVAAAGTPIPTTCMCGETNTCAPFKCSCDQNLTTWGQDAGWLSNKFDLPVTEIIVSDPGFAQQAGKFSVGPLICN